MARRAACLAGAVAGAVAVGIAVGPAALGEPALGEPAQSQSAPASRVLSVVIESVTPQWATPGRKVTVTGVVRNGTTTAQQGLSVQLRSSASPLTNRTDLGLYAAGTYTPDIPEGMPVPLPKVIPPGREVSWKATLQPSVAGMTVFGVYPLAAQVLSDVAAPVSTDRTFLPFWPGHRAQSRPRPLSIAWVWPLIDHPYQAACPALFSNALASRLATGGRLGRLLAAGASYSATAHLTWAIDPALVQNAHTMTHRYAVGGFPDCGNPTSLPPSQAARSWLNGLTRATAGQQVFLTPYADTDVAALSHVGLDADVKRAFGYRRIGQQILHLPAAGDIAWPVDGLADSGVLGSLAASGIKTVVLDSGVMPPAGPPLSYTPSAQASVASSIGTSLNVLLADNTITQILRSGNSARPGAVFATGQRFLAETAMIVAESPQLARSLVVAPPRRWNPAPGLPGDLLSETARAPWLKPTSLAALAAVKHPTGQVRREAPPERQVSGGELSASYLSQVKGLDEAVSVQGSILVPPQPGYLGTSVAALESSAWRGGPAALIRQGLIRRVSRYLADQGRKVSIIDRGQVTLSGSSGKVPISITNRQPGPVKVKLHARVPPDNRLTVGSFDNVVSIPAGKTTTIRVPLHAPTVGVTYVTLDLLAPDGTPLPGTLVRLSVHATRFGLLAEVIISAALGVFVLTAFARAVRRSRRDGHGGGKPGRPGPDPPGPAAATGSVMSGDDLAHDHPPEDPDEYADARGRASR